MGAQGEAELAETFTKRAANASVAAAAPLRRHPAYESADLKTQVMNHGFGRDEDEVASPVLVKAADD